MLPAARFDGKVVRGKDGWLFIEHDTNEVMRQQYGDLLFTQEQLFEWRTLLEERTSWLKERGIAYHFLVPPNPQSVYPEKLPRPIPPGTQRPVIQLTEYLSRVDSSLSFIYPLARLNQRRDEPIYTKTGSHWTYLGAFIAYEALMDAIGNAERVRRLSAAEVMFEERMIPGGLGRKMDPPETSLHVIGTPIDTAARVTLDNRVFLNGHRMDYECPVAGDMRCLVFGDSFAHAMLPFLAETFGGLVYAHLPTLDRQLVSEVQPHVVVSILNERFLIRVPVDSGAKSLEECASEKHERGEVYPPRVTQGTRVETPYPQGANRP